MLALAQELMYNAHGLIPDPYLGSISCGHLSCDCYGPGPDPWKLFKITEQLSFICVVAAAFIATARSVPYLLAWGVYFLAQATQGLLTLNLQINEIWSDAIMLSALMLTAFLWSQRGPLKEAVLKVVYIKEP